MTTSRKRRSIDGHGYYRRRIRRPAVFSTTVGDLRGYMIHCRPSKMHQLNTHWPALRHGSQFTCKLHRDRRSLYSLTAPCSSLKLSSFVVLTIVLSGQLALISPAVAEVQRCRGKICYVATHLNDSLTCKFTRACTPRVDYYCNLSISNFQQPICKTTYEDRMSPGHRLVLFVS